MKKYSTPLFFLSQCQSISGIDFPDEMMSYGEMYIHRFLEILLDEIKNEEQFSTILNTVSNYNSVGDFLSNETDINIIAAYGLVSLDRICKNWDDLSKSELFYLHEQLFECCEICGEKISKRSEARSKAYKRHKENRDMKKDVFSWLDENREKFKSIDATAEEISKNVVPIKFRTAQSWVSEWRKIRSASKT